MPRIMLNNTFIFQLGPLDQGYWPDGLFTPPTEEAVLFDLNALKAYGFNMLRKHVKVESRRFYSLCDRLGLMVWQDMPSGDRSIGGNAPDIERTPQSARQYEYELRQMVETRFNHPSIVMWIPFNEGWGQFDTERIVDYIREIDPTRLIDNASGWADRGVGDIRDLHAYPGPAPVYPDGKRAAVLGEFGGLGLNVSGHTWQLRGWGYALYHNQEELLRRYERLYSELLPLIDEAGISGAVYTQLSDIESENNGLMTYDRKVFKVEPAYAALAHKGIFPPRLESRSLLFVDEAQVKLSAPDKRAAVRYTVDGSDPDTGSPLYTDPFRLDTSVIVRARAFYPNREESRVEDFSFRKVAPSPPLRVDRTEQGLWMEIFPGHWDLLPDFSGLDAKASRAVTAIDLNLVPLNEDFGLRFRGLLRIPRRGVYVFTLTSDDGSRLDIGGGAAIDLDGVHGARSQRCEAALEAGYHAIMLEYFQRGGGKMLRLEVEGQGLERQELPSEWLYYDPREIVR